MSSVLAIWMNGEFVGTWSVRRHIHRLNYDPAWLLSPRARALSLSLPFTANLEVSGPKVANYFDNLLPDSDKIRERLRSRFRLKSGAAFSLLEAIGRDCVGAVQLLPEGEQPTGWDRVEGEALTDAQVADLLRAVPSETVLGQANDDDLFRISIAGAQEKTALLWHDKKWHRPTGATPSTHIIKLPLGMIGGIWGLDLSDSVANEWVCSRILYHLHFPVADVEMVRFEDQEVLAVRRFDRSWQSHSDGRQWIARLPQEDFCQALGRPPSEKYESKGGPSIDECMRMLAQGNPDDRELFALAQLAFWIMAATDGHAKNFSIYLQKNADYIMTPLYDVLSVFPYIGNGAGRQPWKKASLAFSLRSKNAHYHLHSIKTRHWYGLAMAYGGEVLWQAMQRLVERVDEALKEVEATLPKGFPQATWAPISEGMRSQVKRFMEGIPYVKE